MPQTREQKTYKTGLLPSSPGETDILYGMLLGDAYIGIVKGGKEGAGQF